MDAETRWANRKEWAQERGEIEIKWKSDNLGPSVIGCEYSRCQGPSVRTWEVGPVATTGGTPFDLCHDHDNADAAFLCYERANR